MALSVSVTRKEPGVYLIAPIGSLDSDTYATMEHKVHPLLVPETKALIVDMEHVNYISSMGVSVILRTKKEIETLGGSFLLINLQPQIKTVFEIIKALPPEGVFESIEEADRYLAEMQRRVMGKGKEQEPSY
jgi:anti-anti-sigma factor